MSIFGKQKDLDQVLIKYFDTTCLMSMRRTNMYYNNLIHPTLCTSIGDYLETLPQDMLFYYEHSELCLSDNEGASEQIESHIFVLQHIVLINHGLEYELYGSFYEEFEDNVLHHVDDVAISISCKDCFFNSDTYEIQGEDCAVIQIWKLQSF
jgi:hypothetical protein